MIRKRGITTISLLIIGILLIAGGLSYTAYTYSLSPQDPTQSVESVDSTKTEDISNSNEDSEVTRKVGMAITTFNVGERGWVKSPISGGVFVFHDKKCAHEFTEIHSSYHLKKTSSLCSEDGTFLPNGIQIVVLEVDGSLRKIKVQDLSQQDSNDISGWISVNFLVDSFPGDN